MKSILTLALFLWSQLSYGQQILPISQGITLAQIKIENNVETLLVVADNGTNIDAINLSKLFNSNKDMISLYQEIGFNRFVNIPSAHANKVQRYLIDKLLSPAGKNSHHVALGLNYQKHANEVNAKQQPFLFVKATKATRQQDITVSTEELLDYEIELCARPLTALDSVPMNDTPAFGLFLCGDFTDRAKLLKNMDVDNLQSGRGFSLAKSKKNYFPTGPYLVISKNWQDFIDNTRLTLQLNGQLKQNVLAKELIWPLSTILEKSWQHNSNNKPVHNEQVTSLLPNNQISPAMVFLTGTPEGIMFRPPTIDFKISSALKFTFLGHFFNRKLTDYVIEQYSQKLLAEKAMLQPGDQLTLSANYLGKLSINIVAAQDRAI
jgi:2-keto-4-pentenoate hydratase/2-oxohepta-3-ene-1,7-dioic acid hydratase in catechol pathway